jgi:tetratricopeptide (TPR) repeat protein
LILAEAGIAHAPEQPDFWFYHAYVHAIQNQLAKAAESIEKCVSTLENFRMVHAGQSNPYLLNIPWKVYALAAEIFWYLNRYDQAYPYFLKTISLKPESEDGWPFILNSACAIAIENNDESKLPILLEKLIVMPNVPLDMFFLRVQNLIDQNQNTKAKELLIWAKRKSSRLRKDEQFNSYCEKFDI